MADQSVERWAIPLEASVVKKIADGSVDWSRFVRRDFDELCMAKQGFDPALVATNLELLVPIYADDQASKLKLQMLINEFHAASRAGTTCGKSEITHLAAKQATGELIGTFIVHRYRPGPDGKSCVDFLMIHASQKLSVDWTAFAIEGSIIALLGFLINPAFGLGPPSTI